jgi:hypothetical protein
MGVREEERDPSGWVLKALREAGNALLSELRGVDEDALRRRPEDGEWSLKEIAAHIRDAEQLALRQIQAILDGHHRPLPAWDIDLLPFERDYRSAELTRLLGEFRNLRRDTTSLLWGLMPSGWESSGDHPYRGSITVGQIARELAQHDLEHLWQVRRVKERLGVTAAGGAPRPEDWW